MTRGDILRYRIAFALMRPRKIVTELQKRDRSGRSHYPAHRSAPEVYWPSESAQVLATTIVRHNVNEPTYYRIDDRQNRHDGPHRQPYLAAAGLCRRCCDRNTQSAKALLSPSTASPATLVANCTMSPIQSGQIYLMTGSISSPGRPWFAKWRHTLRPHRPRYYQSTALAPQSG